MRASTNSASSLVTKFTFAEIDQRISYLRSPDCADLLSTGADPMDRLVTLYEAVRPIVLVVVGLPLIQPSWRSMLKMFVTNLDSLVTAFDPTFKAGKDL